MIKKIFHLLIITSLFALPAKTQTITPEQYIALYKDIAIREMRRMGVPAAISLAQGLLETESGNSDLVKKSNNHFGIKCKNNWTAGGVTHDDDARGECFRSYKNADESYRDHSNFLRGSDRYAPLFMLNPTDYKGWAYGLKRAGYATNPAYPAILIKNIEQYNLQQYSLAGARGVPRFESEKYKDDTVVFDKDQTMENVSQTGNTAVLKASAGDKNNEAALAVGNPGQVNVINGSRCIYARKGTSLLAIASKYNISLQKLLDINELEDDGILEEDQLMFLQKKSKTCDKDFVIVTKKKTLYDVAQENGILLESLLEYNQLSQDDDVTPGSKLYLKAMPAAAQEKKGQGNTLTNAKLYEVQAKENLYAVARKYSISVQQLREWNNLTSDELKVGQQLIVGK